MFSPSEVTKLKELIESGQKENIDLACAIIEGSEECFEYFLTKYCKELTELLIFTSLEASSEGIRKLIFLRVLVTSLL